MSILAAAPCDAVGQTATQVVTFSVVSSSELAMGSLAASTEVAAPDRRRRTSVMVAGTTYAVATNETNQKVTASLDVAVPSSVSLSVALDAPRGAASRGMRTLGTTATDVVTGITGADGAVLPMRYQWNDSRSGSAAALRNRVVTYTITAGL